MANRTYTAIEPTPTVLRRRRGLWADAVARLLHNRLAVLGAVVVLTLIVLAIFAPLITPKHYADVTFEDNNTSPGSKYLLGADYLGRDVLSRLIYGARVSLTIGIAGATIATIIGLIYGSISAYYGGKVDNLMMRFVDLMYGFPTLLLIILIMVYFRSTFTGTGEEASLIVRTMRFIDDSVGGMFFIFIGVSITSWMTASRLVRGIVLSLKEKDFILAAHALGNSDRHIMVRHLLPNLLGPIIIAETLNIPTYILIEAFLSFIGLGVNPPMPSWGGMINDGRGAISSYPHLVLFPSLFLSITLMAFNFLGDGLRDALDPRMKR